MVAPPVKLAWPSVPSPRGTIPTIGTMPTDVSIPRAVAWTLTLFVRQSDPESRDREADRLANVAQNVLDGQSLAGITLPGLTKIRRGRWERSPAPERRLVLMGEFTYLVNAFDGHDTTE
jgi:hypothetical protein